ncbi:hypothetical protein VF21_06337 [Pseudogymnoascus sp. 05NY08]|nr:hypothetical protein VF21_06337 [Pseudogymnoascus sp. 05NY08]
MPPWYNIELPSLHHYDNPPDLDVADERNPSPQPHISDSRTHNAPWASRGTLNDSTDNLWRTDSPPSTAAGHQDARTPILNQHETFRCSVGTKSPLQSKRERFLMTWLTCAAAIVSTIFSVYYSYTVLVSDKAVPQALSLSPGKTVMAINVLSHVVAYLLWSLITDANEELRWSLACRPQGVTLTSFLVLSRATPLHGVAYLCTVWGGHILWALQKIIAMGLVTLLGLVLITDVTFKNMYTAVHFAAAVPVVAGLAPLSIEFLPYVLPSLISVYAGSYTYGFLTDPRFVANMEPINCKGDTCLSVFLPGGLHTVRVASGDKNSTLFKGELGDGKYESIIVNQAPGYQVEFYDLPDNYKFKNEECTIYMDEIGFSNYGLYVCIATYGSDLLSGWTVCPTDAGVGNCGQNTTWTQKYPMDQATTTSMYKRYATVAYDAKNMSILSIERLTYPQATAIDADIIRTYFGIVMQDQPAFANSTAPAFSNASSTTPVFKNNREAANACTSYTVQYGIFWILSLYRSDFSSYADGGLAVLRGFLSIPLQFSTEIWQQAAMDTLPDDLRVDAQLSRVSYRALIQAWTVYIFGGSAFIVLAWCIGCLWWCYLGPYTPNSSYFPEIDITSKGTSPAAAVRRSDGNYAPSMRSGRVSSRTLHYPQFGPFEKGVEQEEELEDLEYLMRKLGLGNGMSRAVVKGVKGKRIYCGAYLGEMGEADHIVIVTEKDRVRPLVENKLYC